MTRTDRRPDELRPVKITRGYTEFTPGSVLIEMGKTKVLCTATVEPDVPRWMRDGGKGWVTAEYAMLPGSSRERISRNAISGGRVKEIQRLIGRALRAVVDMETMGEAMVRVDCDVLQADGGTRTASITGAWVALHDAFEWAVGAGMIAKNPIVDHCAAISVGLVGGEVLL
ncbi:MAG: ribonuclease PH, partial [Acidimicrobiia bacterium]|nr:ribonuclease PH [Acidimicrobiia bacterium]